MGRRQPNQRLDIPSLQELLATGQPTAPANQIDYVQSGIQGLNLADVVQKRQQGQQDREKSIMNEIQKLKAERDYKAAASKANPSIANEIGYLPKDSAESILKSNLAKQSNESKLAQLQMQILAKGSQDAGKAPELTKGQEAADKAFGSDYNDYVGQGGAVGSQMNLSKLDNSINTIKNLSKGSKLSQIAQRAAGVLPDKMRAFITPDTVRAEQDARANVLGILRQTLGAQFTEKEGERIFSQTFDPRLPAEINLDRITKLRDSLQGTAHAKEAAIRHFEKHGTLTGFTGQLPDMSQSQTSQRPPLDAFFK